MNLLILGPPASKGQKGLERSLRSAQGNTHPTAAGGSRAGSKGARRRERSLTGSAAPQLPHKHTGRDYAGSRPRFKAGEIPGRSERTRATGVGGIMCGFEVPVTHFSLSSPRKSPDPTSRPRAAPPVPLLSTHPHANLPRLHVKASSAATRKLISSRWPASLSHGSFRVVAEPGGRLP